MTEAYAVFFRLPFEKNTLIVYSIGNKIYNGTTIKLPSIDNLIALNFSDYSSNMLVNDPLPNTIFDINSARKIVEGKPKSEFNKNKEPWKGLSAIARSFTDPALFRKIIAI
jgi:hypothetical protein